MCSRNRVFKSTITFAAETGCLKVQLHVQQKKVFESTITLAAERRRLKVKTVAKLYSREMNFWLRSARIPRKDKIRNFVIKQKLIH